MGFATVLVCARLGRMGLLFAPFHLVFLLIFGLPLLALHFLPAIISGVRHTRNFGWILAVNFFLGWTVVGWVVALVWALKDEPRYAAYPMRTMPPPPYNR